MELKECVNLETAMEFLSKQVGFKTWLKESEEEATIGYHHTLGREIRNGMELWNEESPMSKWFHYIGIYHADDMSSLILTSLHRKYNNNIIDVKGQLKKHIGYWNEVNPDINKGIFKK